MVSDAVLAKQLKRLLAVPFPVDASGSLLPECKRILKSRSANDAHCEAVVDYLVEHTERPLSAAAIVRACSIVPKEKPMVQVSCSKCLDTGWLEGNYRDADFCNCQKGKADREEWGRRAPVWEKQEVLKAKRHAK